jgi:hypothetical protein
MRRQSTGKSIVSEATEAINHERRKCGTITPLCHGLPIVPQGATAGLPALDLRPKPVAWLRDHDITGESLH